MHKWWPNWHNLAVREPFFHCNSLTFFVSGSRQTKPQRITYAYWKKSWLGTLKWSLFPLSMALCVLLQLSFNMWFSSFLPTLWNVSLLLLSLDCSFTNSYFNLLYFSSFWLLLEKQNENRNAPIVPFDIVLFLIATTHRLPAQCALLAREPLKASVNSLLSRFSFRSGIIPFGCYRGTTEWINTNLTVTENKTIRNTSQV